MSEAIKIRCPHCEAGFKIKDSSRLGKKLRCPKCETPFVAKALKRKPNPSPATKEPTNDLGLQELAPRRRPAPKPTKPSTEELDSMVAKRRKETRKKRKEIQEHGAYSSWKVKTILFSIGIWYFCWSMLASDYAEAVDGAVAGEISRKQVLVDGEWMEEVTYSTKGAFYERFWMGITYLPHAPQIIYYTILHNRGWPIFALLVQGGTVGVYFWGKRQEQINREEERKRKEFLAETGVDSSFYN